MKLNLPKPPFTFFRRELVESLGLVFAQERVVVKLLIVVLVLEVLRVRQVVHQPLSLLRAGHPGENRRHSQSHK